MATVNLGDNRPERELECQAREKLDELLELSNERLTPWEVNFLDDLSHQKHMLTERQVEILDRIYDKCVR